METATCPTCKQTYERPDGKRGGWWSYCRPCYREKRKEYRYVLSPEQRERQREAKRRFNQRHRERLNAEAREYQHRKRLERHGMTASQYDQLLLDQGGGCAICGARESDARAKLLAIDHDHQTGTVRGLLCGRCNKGIGLLLDDPLLLDRAIHYLRGDQ